MQPLCHLAVHLEQQQTPDIKFRRLFSIPQVKSILNMMTLCCNDASLFEKLTDIAGYLSLSSFTRLLIVMLYSLSYTVNFDLFYSIHSQKYYSTILKLKWFPIAYNYFPQSQNILNSRFIYPTSFLHRPFIVLNQ